MFTSCLLQKGKKKRKQKRNKRKKSLPFLPLFVRLLLKVKICSAFKCNYLQTSLSMLSSAYTSALTQHCMGISLSVRPVDQQRRQLAVRFYSRWYYVRSGVGVSARRIRSATNRFYTKQTKILRPKKFRIRFFEKNPKKLFVAQKINLKDT